MSEDLDQKLGRLLRDQAIPERDPVFRIRVLERGERQRYRQRARRMLVLAALAAGVPMVLFAGISRLPTPELLQAALITTFLVALIVAALCSFRGLVQAARWLRRR
jgi:peptidoglycan/LPS O-acetylase OafA/YrhL